LHKFLRVFTLNPLSKANKTELLLFESLFEPLEIVDKYFFSVLFLKNTVYEVTAEELKLYFTSHGNIFSDLFVCFGEYMANYQTISLLEIREFTSFHIEVVS